MELFFDVITQLLAILSFIISIIALNITKKEHVNNIKFINNDKLKNRFIFILRRFPDLTMGQIADELMVSHELTHQLFLEMQIDDKIIDTADYPIRYDTKWKIINK